MTRKSGKSGGVFKAWLLTIGVALLAILLATHGAGAVRAIVAEVGWQAVLVIVAHLPVTFLATIGWQVLLPPDRRPSLPFLFRLRLIKEAVNALLPVAHPELARVAGANQQQATSLMMLSGTSVSAPVVSGAVALMLQANPGLTPPLVKAILQYTAQALPNASIAQQGAGALNIEGAVRLAAALRNDMNSRIQAGGSIGVTATSAIGTTGFTVSLTPSWNGTTVNWTCTGTPAKYAPSSCRG